MQQYEPLEEVFHYERLAFDLIHYLFDAFVIFKLRSKSRNKKFIMKPGLTYLLKLVLPNSLPSQFELIPCDPIEQTDLILQQMDSQSQRQQRISKIKTSLSKMSILSKNSLQVEAKQEKSRNRKQSLQLLGALQSQKLLRKFTLEDEQENQGNLNTFLQNYQLISKIGEGANAVVHTCQYLKTGKIYAVKKISMEPEHLLELKRNFISIKHLCHPGLIRYHALYFDLRKHAAYLVMEYFPFPALSQHRVKQEGELKAIFGELLEAISHLHERNICHRDIKPENILYDSATKRIKLIDFGISKRTFLRGERRDMITVIGTPQYLAPEILIGGGYDQKVDLWAVGISLFKMITGRTPFESEYVSDTIANIRKNEVPFDKLWENYSFFIKDFTMRLLKPKDDRLSAKQALRHLWISQNSPTRERKTSQFIEERRLLRRDSFKQRAFQGNSGQQNVNVKNAKSKEEGDLKPRENVGKLGRLNLIENKEFDLEDSGEEEEGTPSTSKSSKNSELDLIKSSRCSTIAQ